MEGVYRRTARLLEIKSIIILLGTEVQTREKCYTKTLFLAMFPFLPASRNIASTETFRPLRGQ